jgi:WD40 repeat protein
VASWWQSSGHARYLPAPLGALMGRGSRRLRRIRRRLFGIRPREGVGPVGGHSARVTRAEWSPAGAAVGATIVTASDDGSARLWRASPPPITLSRQQKHACNGVSHKSSGRLFPSSSSTLLVRREATLALPRNAWQEWLPKRKRGSPQATKALSPSFRRSNRLTSPSSVRFLEADHSCPRMLCGVRPLLALTASSLHRGDSVRLQSYFRPTSPSACPLVTLVV